MKNLSYYENFRQVDFQKSDFDKFFFFLIKKGGIFQNILLNRQMDINIMLLSPHQNFLQSSMCSFRSTGYISIGKCSFWNNTLSNIPI